LPSRLSECACHLRCVASQSSLLKPGSYQRWRWFCEDKESISGYQHLLTITVIKASEYVKQPKCYHSCISSSCCLVVPVPLDPVPCMPSFTTSPL
jgi:hypothetical protein